MNWPVPHLPPTAPFVLSQLTLPDDGSKWILIGGGMLIITYLVIRPMGKRKKDPLDAGSASSSGSKPGLSQQRSVEREMSNLLVELSEMARQITAQLDTRATKLELLIKEADEKLAALRAATDGTAPGARPGRATAPDDDAVAPALLSASLLPVAPPPSSDRIDPRHEQIYALADRGLGPRDIARDLGRPTGEIELILALRPQATQ